MIIMWQGITDMDNSCSPSWDSIGPYQNDYSNKLRVLYDIVHIYYESRPLINLISLNYARDFFNDDSLFGFFK